MKIIKTPSWKNLAGHPETDIENIKKLNKQLQKSYVFWSDS